METKVSVYVDDRKKDKDSMYHVYIVVSRGRNGRFLLNTGLTTSRKFCGREFPASETNHSIKTTRLNRLFGKIEDVCLRNESATIKELKSIIGEKVFDTKTTEKTFVSYIYSYADTCKEGTAGIYRQTARKVEAFDRNATFDTITGEWLRKFESFCSNTMSVNGMSILFRNIRTVFNRARKDGKTDKYPFLDYKIKSRETQKRNISLPQIIALKNHKCKNTQECEYRDVWMLMFYLIGINAKDLFTAKKEQISSGRLKYRRAKTGKLYSIKIEPEAMDIIDRYKGKEYLLNMCERYKDYKEYLRHMDRALKKIGMKYSQYGGYEKDSKPLIENLDTYSARHSWATIAADLDITFEVISAALGHSIANPTTAIYINFNQKKVDEANRKVIDSLFKTSSSNP